MNKSILRFCACLLAASVSFIQAKGGVGPINGPAIAVCGVNNVSYHIAGDVSAVSYSWTVPSGAVLTSGQGSNYISVNFSNTYTTGIISVTTNYLDSSSTLSLTVSGIPSVPVIDPPGPYCKTKDAVCNVNSVGASSYYWNLASTLQFDVLAGDSSQTYIIWDVSGTVQGRNTCGLSVPLTLVVNDCLAGVAQAKGNNYCAEVYPNPAADRTTVTFTGTGMSNYYVSLLDITGREVMRKKGETMPGLNNVNIDLSNLARGIYLINLITGEHISQLRLAVK